MDITTIALNQAEKEAFDLFKRHQRLFERLEESGAFNIAFGKITLNIAFNEVRNIVKEELVKLP